MSNIYIYLDEAGNFDFSSNGTKYLVFTSLTTLSPFEMIDEFAKTRYNIIENEFRIINDIMESLPGSVRTRKKTEGIAKKLHMERFHATEDLQIIRDSVFDILNKKYNYEIDAVVIEKSKANPSIYALEIIYPKIYQILLKYVFDRYNLNSFSNVIIFTDTIPLKSKREAINKGIKIGMKKAIETIPGTHRTVLHTLHHDSRSNYYLQATDYCAWAIYKKWTDNEVRPYEKIQQKIISEFDIFERGDTNYY